MNRITTALIGAFALANVGCATSEPINDLATVTAANVSVVGSSLSRFADDANLLAQDRARALQSLSNQLDRSDRQLMEDLIVMKNIGALKPFSELEGLLEDSRTIHTDERREYSDALLNEILNNYQTCLLYTSPSPRDQRGSRMPSSA